MRKCSLLPSYSGRCSLPSMLALAQLSLLAISCATVAGFEDFSASGGHAGTVAHAGGTTSNGGASFNVIMGGQAGATGTLALGGSPAGGSVGTGGLRATGGLAATGGAANCGQAPPCGAGLECYANACRQCGANGQSCCDPGSVSQPCNPGAVCITSNGDPAVSLHCSLRCPRTKLLHSCDDCGDDGYRLSRGQRLIV